jgi:hypothetical protein
MWIIGCQRLVLPNKDDALELLFLRFPSLHFLSSPRFLAPATMMFKSAIIASLVASAASFVPIEGIDATSKAGQKLLSKARSLENNKQDITWMVGYNIKYLGCTSLMQVNPNEGGQDNTSMLYTQNLVKFALCSTTGTCSSCGNGDAQYVVPMNDFVDAWTEAEMTVQKQTCEAVRETCYCDNANDDQNCEATCFANKGYDYCTQYDEDFEVQRFMECGGKSKVNKTSADAILEQRCQSY